MKNAVKEREGIVLVTLSRKWHWVDVDHEARSPWLPKVLQEKCWCHWEMPQRPCFSDEPEHARAHGDWEVYHKGQVSMPLELLGVCTGLGSLGGGGDAPPPCPPLLPCSDPWLQKVRIGCCLKGTMTHVLDSSAVQLKQFVSTLGTFLFDGSAYFFSSTAAMKFKKV